MKKALLFLASAALLIVGCNKEQLSNGTDGGMITATFTANLESGVATRAVADGDGAAANVNRCIMEIYYGDALYARQISKVTDKQATFNAQVVSNRGYTVAFWADCVDDATSDAGLAADKYYNTASLKEISIKGSYVGNDDARDAFYVCEPFTVQQTGGSFSATLKRPFAQMNVITTDWDKVTTVEALKPEKVKVTLKNAMVVFNAVTGEASGSQDITYEAAVYTAPAPVAPVSATDKTLSMDYLFASATKGVIDIDWKALHGTDIDVKHTFAAVPYQRNYRTNIKGALLTTQGKWTVTVDPIWSAPTYSHPVVIATTLEEAQAAVGPNATAGTEAAGIVIVQPEAVTNRDKANDKEKAYVEATTTGINLPGGAKAIEFVLTPQSQKDVTFELPALPDGNFYWYIRHEEGYPTENLNVKVSDTDATRVIIDAPNNTHVVLNDVEYSHVIAITGDNTLVVPQGITVDKLTVKKGGVEIHGEVTELEVAPGENQKVYFRECEGLSEDVFKKIYSETEPVCNYIDPWYTYEKVGEVYNIKKLPIVATIGENIYKSIEDAVAAVQDGDILNLVSDVTLSEKLLINGGKDFTLDLGGKTLTGRVNVDGAKLVVKNGKIDAGSFKQALNVYGSKDPKYKDDIYTYVKVESDVTLDGSACALGVLPVYGETYYPLSYGVKVDFYGKAYNVPAQVIGNLGFDNYKSNIGNVDISANLPAGITAPSKAMSLYGPIVNIYGEMKSTSVEEECQAFILSGMARVNVYEGAYLEGSEGFAMKSGNLHVYGGTIKSNGEKKDPVQAVNSGSEASGAAISITSYYTHDMFEDRAKIQVSIEGGDIQSVNNAALLVTHSYAESKPVALKQGVDLAISGGKFTSGSGVPVIFIDNTAEGDAFAMPSKFISGGLYNIEPDADYIVAGKKSELNAQGYWEIVMDELAIVNGVKYATVGEAIDAANTGDVINVYGTTNFTKADDGFCYTDASNKKGRLVLVELVNAGSPTTNASLKVNTAPAVNSMTFQTLWLGSESRLDAPGSYLKSGDVLVLPAKTFYIDDRSTIYDVYGDITFLGKKGKTVMKPWQTSASAYRFFRLYNRYKKNITDGVIYHFHFKDVTFDGSFEKHASANLFVVTCYNIQINMDGCTVVNFPGSVFSIWANDTLSDGSYPSREDNVGVEVNITNSTLTGNGRLVHYDCSPYQSRDLDAGLDRYAFIHVNYDNSCTVSNTEPYSVNANTAKGQGNCLLNGVDVWPAEN